MSLFNSLFAKEKKTDANNGKEDVTQNLDLSGLKYFEKKEQLKHIKKLESIVNKINACEEVVLHQTAPFNIDEAEEYFKNKTAEFKERVAKGESLDDILPEAFAIVRVASARILNMRHYDVQLMGGIVLHQGRVAEMQTGEGKTLVATLPAYLNALAGKGVHVVTVNEYLAKRDAEWMGKLYNYLGLTVGCVYRDMSKEERKRAYECDITYATNSEIGFDYLRDNMEVESKNRVQRGHSFVIVDEVDSILIDEARTPLIISGSSGEVSDLYVNVNRFVKRLREGDYELEEKDNRAYLTEDGLDKAETYFNMSDKSDYEQTQIRTHINTALRANFLMHANKDYIVENGEIVIVDEFTGRKMVGRRYSEGLHQAIEAKENVKIKKESVTIASITFQNYFRMYRKLSGMTGTAYTEEAEFRGIYNLDVVKIPSNKPVVRVDEPDKIYAYRNEKIEAVIEDIKECYEYGQPVLVGTTSVEASEELSIKLRKMGIKHNVLNAKLHAEEAEIIAQAGRLNAVTIATNMAGRGTDILLGGNPENLAKAQMRKKGYSLDLIKIATAKNPIVEEEQVEARKTYKELYNKFLGECAEERAKVLEKGGLRVIGTERHEARRIDNQLRGRSGRQGDKGSSCFYLSCEDDIARLFGGEKLQSAVAMGGGNIQMGLLSRLIEAAQKRCEENNYAIRKRVLEYDDVMNKQRQLIYTERNEVLDGKDVHDQILKYFKPIVEEIVYKYLDAEGEVTDERIALFNRDLEDNILERGTNLITREVYENKSDEKIEEYVYDTLVEQYEAKIKRADEENISFKETERNVLLRQVDKNWMQHIANMDQLRKSIGLRALAQRDPVIEYRREGMDMFDQMIENIQETTARMLAKIDIESVIERKNLLLQHIQRHVTVRNTDENKTVGRNDPCPCGSGKKYKNCCGK
ncbi:MAG: preprotein translocase subunit SecA [Clostridia bacterium]|nr:preprotein translocase subunit SecA [Clostridia bacterium]